MALKCLEESSKALKAALYYDEEDAWEFRDIWQEEDA